MGLAVLAWRLLSDLARWTGGCGAGDGIASSAGLSPSPAPQPPSRPLPARSAMNGAGGPSEPSKELSWSSDRDRQASHLSRVILAEQAAQIAIGRFCGTAEQG